MAACERVHVAVGDRAPAAHVERKSLAAIALHDARLMAEALPVDVRDREVGQVAGRLRPAGATWKMVNSKP